jgi:hypothetical protein
MSPVGYRTKLPSSGKPAYTPQETDMDDIKQFIIANWKSASALRTLLGTDFPENDVFYFGEIPTEQAKITVESGKIVRITTWSGLSWTARNGYGNPVVDVF